MLEINLDVLVIDCLKVLLSNPKKVIIVYDKDYPSQVVDIFSHINSLREEQQRAKIDYESHKGLAKEYNPDNDCYIIDLNKIKVNGSDDYLERIIQYERTIIT